MKILDFLFYFLTRWFQVSDRRKKKTISYPDQAAYALAICSILWLITINGVIEYFLFNTFESKIPAFIFIIVGLLLYFVFRNIYIKKGRYNLIDGKIDPKFNVSDMVGRTISLIVFFSSVIFLMLTAIILHGLK